MRVDSGPDNDEAYQYCQMVRARLARRTGVREEPVTERPSSYPPAPTWRIWAGSHRAPAMGSDFVAWGGELRSWRMSSAREAMVEVCGEPWRWCRGIAGHRSRRAVNSERGNPAGGPTSAGQPARHRWEGSSPTDISGSGRRARSSPRSGKPATWRRGSVCFAQQPMHVKEIHR